jgi:ATP-dependent helicase HrpA
MSLVEKIMLELPILAKELDITATYAANQVMILVGETGSGKTTKMPVFVHKHNVATGRGGKIGVTQPRRVAATSTATYVAQQLGTVIGGLVGYQIRFEEETADHTRIKFMTDGILLQEIQRDPELREYSTIIVDEAHERSENIDFLLGLLKNLLKRRPDLKLVVTSATIDQQKFSRYFNNAPVVNVSGRMYPVDIIWSETDHSEWMMVETVAQQVLDIHKTKPLGDILVFMTGGDDINKVIAKLENEELRNLVVLPIYGDLSLEEQRRIFQRYPGKRKVVVATNIAETSITVEGIVYVVDSGLIKQANFHPDTGIQSLDIVEHSRAGCEQRAGRAGRVQSGVCYRMYTKENFQSRPAFTTPEILRVSLANVVLKMENIGIADVEGFDFIDAPNSEAFHEAYETLIALGAIRRGVAGLTEIGRGMARLPLDPRTSRMVLEAEKHGCVKNVATVAAFLSVRNIFVRPKQSEYEADRAHQQFKDSKSDALTFLNVWAQYEHSGYNNQWCF